MTSKHINSTLLALAVAAATAFPGSAGAAKPVKVEKADFKVTVEGVQRTTWETNHIGLGGCDGDLTGGGTEKVRFGSKPVRVTATMIEGLSAPLFSHATTKGEPVARLRGTVQRQGDLISPPGECGGSGGGSIPRDCGSKRFAGVDLPIAYRLAATPKDQLAFDHEFIDDPFRNCPSGGYAFPTLVGTVEGEYMRSELPRAELFDKSLGKIIVIARGKETETAGEHTYTTSIRWVVTFTRIK